MCLFSQACWLVINTLTVTYSDCGQVLYKCKILDCRWIILGFLLAVMNIMLFELGFVCECSLVYPFFHVAACADNVSSVFWILCLSTTGELLLWIRAPAAWMLVLKVCNSDHALGYFQNYLLESLC